jgi:superfamily II DNA or RNA helicase
LFENAHWKGFLFEHKSDYNTETRSESKDLSWHTFIIGSSNLTGNALTVNRELNIKIFAHENGSIYKQLIDQFDHDFNNSEALTPEVLGSYELMYRAQKIREKQIGLPGHYAIKAQIEPNSMQARALASLQRIHERGDQRALVISATGTGKTYLAAFDVKRAEPKTFLFIVHREVIARKAMESFRNILNSNVELGIYAGQNQSQAPYLFATIQTLSRDEHLEKFKSDHFDYIVIDETHRSGAKTYQKILDHLELKSESHHQKPNDYCPCCQIDSQYWYLMLFYYLSSKNGLASK